MGTQTRFDPSVAGPGLATPGGASQRVETLGAATPRDADQCRATLGGAAHRYASQGAAALRDAIQGTPSKTVRLYADDPRVWLRAHELWCGTRCYDDETKQWLKKSGHYPDAPPPGALLAVSLESFVPGLFGPVPSGALFGLALLGRPIARNLPQDGSWAELTRFVLAPGLAKETASHVLRVAAELWSARPISEALISYHDRSRHSGCVYRKSGFRKDGVTRAGARRGTWASRPGREQGASSEVPSKRRWRLDCVDVRAGVALRETSY